MAEINLFIFKDVDSLLHRTHPTLKIVFLVIASFFISKGDGLFLTYYSLLLLFGFKIAGLKFRTMIRELRYLIILTGIIIIFQLIERHDYILLTLGNSLLYSLRIGLLIFYSILFTGTTKPQDIAPGIYILVRNKSLAQNISLSITLIPTFLLSWYQVKETLESRGIGQVRNPLRIIYYISIPLLVDIFKRSNSISEAMNARSYSKWIVQKPQNRERPIIIIFVTTLPFLQLIKML